MMRKIGWWIWWGACVPVLVIGGVFVGMMLFFWAALTLIYLK